MKQMCTNRRLLPILSGCVASIILALLLWPREREAEPQYKGQSLSTWVMASSGSYNPQAQDAVRHFGTNALPYLVRWIQYEKPSWRKQLKRAVSSTPSFIRYSWPSQWLVSDRAEVRAHGATIAITFLDEEIALPPLRQLESKSNAVEVTDRTSFALAWIKLRSRLRDSEQGTTR